MMANPDADPAELRRQDVESAAERAGFRSPALVARILATEDGDPDELVANLAEAEPYMLREPDMNQRLRRRR